MRVAIISLTLLFPCLAGCNFIQREAAPQRMPTWVQGQASEQTRALYLTAVGYGGSRQTAQAEARAELARVLRSNVSSQVTNLESYLGVRSASRPEEVEERSSVSSVTEISSQMVIEGSEVLDVFRQRRPRRYFTLIGLNRLRTGQLIRAKIRDLDAEAALLSRSAQKATGKLSKARLFAECMTTLIQRGDWGSQLRIVNPRAEVPSPPIKREKTVLALEQVLRSFLIGVAVQGDRASEVRGEVINGLGAIQLSAVPVKPQLGLKFKIKEIDVSLRGDVLEKLRSKASSKLRKAGIPLEVGGPSVDLRLVIQSRYTVKSRAAAQGRARWDVQSRLEDRTGRGLRWETLTVRTNPGKPGEVARTPIEAFRERIAPAIGAQVMRYILGQ